MESCIITVVKNEHLYLDEWIEYHLSLGVGRIFVFEDFDSDTHKQITDKYGDRVILKSVFDILDDKDKETAVYLKKTKKWNVQHIYLRNALRYVKGIQTDGWCFVIDADEFVTIENSEHCLNDVLSMYDGYDAFVMLWECYGADGHIHTPDYRNVGVVGTYKRAVDNRLVDKDGSSVKTCYRLERYKPEFFHNQHHPSAACSWCNTDFQTQSIKSKLTNIYIRHYVTKSWDEYLWKRLTRGFFWGRTRMFDMFFTVNPDLMPIKKTLIKNARKRDIGCDAVQSVRRTG